MTTKHVTPGPAGRNGPRYAGPRSTCPSRAIPWALWLAAMMVAAIAVAAEAPPPPPSSQAPPPPPAADAPKPEAETPAEPEPEAEAPPADAPKPEGEAPPPGAPRPEGEAPPMVPGGPPRPDGPRPEGEAPPTDLEPAYPPIVPGEPLRLNFKDASLHTVLEYISEATGLIIVQEPVVDGRVTIMSHQPLDTEEAIALLDTVLKSKGYAAIRTGRNLRIVALSQAGKENVPVFSGNDPENIPVADKVVTQIIPVRYADATKLKTDLTPLIASTATLTANAASNALVLVDTQANIRRIVEIVQALDGQMSGVAEVKVFQLKYANATNAAKLITDLFKPDDQQAAQSARRMFPFGRGGPPPQGGQSDEKSGREQKVIATADDRTNTLVISAPPDMLKTIEGIIKELDSNPSEEQAVFTYRLKNADAANLETVLNNIFSEYGTAGGTGRTNVPGQTRGGMSQFGRSGTQQIAATANDLVGQVFVVADADTNSLLVRTASKHFERVQEILKDLDCAIPQVLIKVLIAEVTHEDELDLGTEFSILNLQFGATVNGTGDLGGTDERAGGLVTANMNANLASTFNALQRDGRLDVLSRPYILTSDNQEATITIGQEVPFIRNSRTTETGQTVNTIEYEDVGIILKVTPHVNPMGLVNLEVAPEISTVTDTTVPISETVNATVYAKRSAQTKVAILNGQTIVIGGLMEDRIIDAVRKVPGLGDIPLLGALFRHTTKRTVKTELLIFLTPHVAQQPEQLEAMSKDEMAGTKAVQDAAGQGAFDEHMDAMNRGATPPTPPGEPGEIEQP